MKSQNVISKSIDLDGYVLLRGALDADAAARAGADCTAALEGGAVGDSVLTSQRGRAYGARNLLACGQGRLTCFAAHRWPKC